MRNIKSYGRVFGLATYLFIVPISYIFNMFFPDSSSLMMNVLYGLIIFFPLISMFVDRGLKLSVNISEHKQIVIYIFVLITLLFQFLINNNKYLNEYFRYYLLYCLVSYLLICFITNYRDLFKIILVESIIIGLVLVYQTIFKGVYIGHYMIYGFAMLPILIALSACYSVFENKLILIPELLCLYAIFTKANRSCLLAFIIFFVFKWLFCSKEKHTRNQVVRFISLIIFGSLAVLIFFMEIETINNFFKSHGINIRGLDIMIQAINYFDFNTFSSGRGDVWNNAIQMFFNSPIIGNGVGTFESEYGYYAHNFLLDILVQYGLVGFIIFVVFLVKSIQQIKLIKVFEKKIFVFFLLSIWLSKLMFSSSFWEEKTFWIYFIVCFSIIGNNYLAKRSMDDISEYYIGEEGKT